MGKFVDLTGERFERLLVISRARNSSTHQAQFLCRCDCGNEKVIRANALRMALTKSCGCLQIENGVMQGGLSRPKHGHCSNGVSPTYISWRSMWNRCTNVAHDGYARYGGRGIAVCERWLKFENFLADMGERPDGMTIERKDANGNYCPENCHWATSKAQNRNKRNNKLHFYKGESKTVNEWAEVLGIRLSTLEKRLRIGWDIVRAIESPIRRWPSQTGVAL